MAHRMPAADVLALFTGYRTELERAFGSYKPQFEVEGLYRIVPSDQEREGYVISAVQAIMTRWNGDRTYEDLLTRTQFIVNGDPFQMATAIRRRDFELRKRTQVGIIGEQHGVAAAALQDTLIRDALQNGAANGWADGSNFFSAAHNTVPWDPTQGTFSNLNAATALTPANFEAVMETMKGLFGWNNQPMTMEGWVLTVPTALEAQALRIVEQELTVDNIVGGATNTGGNTNINYKRARVRVVSHLNNEPTVWYLSAEGDTIKPLMLQEWRPMEVSRQFDPSDESVFSRDELQMGVSRGLEFGYALPHLISRNAA